MAKRGPKKKVKNTEKVEIENISDTIGLSGEITPAHKNSPVVVDAIAELDEHRNQKVLGHNRVQSQLSNYQEIPPAQSPENVPLAAKTWAPASTLTVTNKKPGRHYCWIKNTPEAIGRALQEKHVVDEDEDTGAEMLNSQDPTGRWKNVKIRGDLILMWMPENVKKARDEYYKSLNVSPADIARQNAQNYKGVGQMTGEISTQRVVEKI